MSAVASAVKHPVHPSYVGEINELALPNIINQVSELPIAVTQAPFAYVDRRVLSTSLLESLMSQHKTQGSDADWAQTLQRRSTNLTPFIGQYLICVLIRLPGVHYTIEVEPCESRVAHWEWQGS